MHIHYFHRVIINMYIICMAIIIECISAILGLGVTESYINCVPIVLYKLKCSLRQLNICILHIYEISAMFLYRFLSHSSPISLSLLLIHTFPRIVIDHHQHGVMLKKKNEIPSFWQQVVVNNLDSTRLHTFSL